MKKVVLLLFVFAAFCLSFESRSEAAKPSSDTPATSTIADIDPVSGSVLRIGSDSLGNYRNNVDSASSIVQGIGNWVLDTKPSQLRKIRVDFGDPVAGTGANPPFQSAFVPARFISKCTTNITTLALNQTITCPLAVSIDYAGATYALRAAEPTAPGTEPVNWKCLARNATKCINWEMTPSVTQPDGQRKGTMQLFRIAARKNQTDTPLGRFYMSFKVNVTTP